MNRSEIVKKGWVTRRARAAAKNRKSKAAGRKVATTKRGRAAGRKSAGRKARR